MFIFFLRLYIHVQSLKDGLKATRFGLDDFQVENVLFLSHLLTFVYTCKALNNYLPSILTSYLTLYLIYYIFNIST